MLLEVKKLSCGYGKGEVLKEVSLAVSENEIVSIMGASGAGKSTLLRSISGFIKGVRGQILFKGNSIAGLNPDQIVKKGIAQVPEGRQLFPKMTVLENIELGAHHRVDKKAIKKDIFEWIFILFPALRERMKQLAGTLSGGEQQMLAIARGLMCRPDLFMLDEPSLGLAPLVIDAVFYTIKEIARNGLATILVEQNSSVALEISARAYVLETGQITLEGTSRDLVDHPHVKKAYLGL